MTKQEMVTIVEACWAAACEARMPGCDEMRDAFHEPGQCSMVRFQTFMALLSRQVPNIMTGDQTD
ncbi:MAG: hypothetical protein KGL39_20605 [Patescibacteria group bacterium]|nr:hypothetical protein [Patescibacteria group bacterium]